MKTLIAGFSGVVALLALPSIALATPIYVQPGSYEVRRSVISTFSFPVRQSPVIYPVRPHILPRQPILPLAPVAPITQTVGTPRRSNIPTFTLPSVEIHPRTYHHPNYFHPYSNQTIIIGPSVNGVSQTQIIYTYPSYPNSILRYGY